MLLEQNSSWWQGGQPQVVNLLHLGEQDSRDGDPCELKGDVPFYDSTKVERVIGLDPAEEMLTYARRKWQIWEVRICNGDGGFGFEWRA